jgi:hypothetical protein
MFEWPKLVLIEERSTVETENKKISPTMKEIFSLEDSLSPYRQAILACQQVN